LVLMLLTVPAMAQQTTNTHTVAPGETLGIIAERYNVSWPMLANANNIVNPNLIYVGQVLTIPSEGTGAGGTPPANGAVPGTTVRYAVRYGDTLSTIAVRYCTTVAAIANASGISVGRPIYNNQTLVIPVGYCYPNGPVYGYPPHDAPIVNRPPAQPAPPPASGGRYYVVRPGDTLFRVGALFGVNIYRVAEANGILNLNRIYAGQSLYIPYR
jgi:LysM repeat protein